MSDIERVLFTDLHPAIQTVAVLFITVTTLFALWAIRKVN